MSISIEGALRLLDIYHYGTSANTPLSLLSSSLLVSKPNVKKTSCIDKEVCTLPGFYKVNFKDTCQPVACNFPWVAGSNVLKDLLEVNVTQSVCVGCPINKVGYYDENLANNASCKPCTTSKTQFCTGATIKPTINLPLALVERAPAFTSTLPNTCNVLPGQIKIEPPAKKTLFARTVGAALVDKKEIDIMILLGFSLAGLVMFVYAVNMVLAYYGRHQITSATRASKALSEAFTHLDYTGSSEYTKDGLHPVPPSAFGGFAFTLAMTAWLTLTISQILTYSLYNELKVPAFTLVDTRILSESLEYVPNLPSGRDNKPLPGLFVLVTAAGDPGQCWGPVGLTSQGLEWTRSGVRSTCIESSESEGEIVQFRLDCRNCIIPPQSSLNFTLNYSCQSLLVEVGAYDANGQLTAVKIPPEETMPRFDPATGLVESPLASASMTVVPVLTLVNSSVDGMISKSRGYALLAGSTARRDRALTEVKLKQVPPAAWISPDAQFVSVGIAFELSTQAMITTVSKKQTLFDLISQLSGLSGIFTNATFIIGAIFVMIHIAGELYEKFAACVGLRGRRAQLAVIQSLRKLVQPSSSSSSSSSHKLTSSHRLTQPSDAAGLKWSRKTDESGDTWYVCDATGESAWELPPGAVLAGEEGAAVMISTENPLHAASSSRSAPVEEVAVEADAGAATRRAAAAERAESPAAAASAASSVPPANGDFTGESPLHESSASKSASARVSRRARLASVMSSTEPAAPATSAVSPPAAKDAADAPSKKSGANPFLDLALSKVRQIHK